MVAVNASIAYSLVFKDDEKARAALRDAWTVIDDNLPDGITARDARREVVHNLWLVLE